MLNAVLRIDSPHADMIADSLGPEAGRELPRTHVEIEKGDGSVSIRFEATDVSAMRAALNSYLGCIKITEDIDRITGD